MRVLVVILTVLLLVTAAYLVVVLRQISRVRRQLEDRLDGAERSAVTFSLVVPQLEALAARVNDTVRQAQAASARTREEERRIRSFIADISHDLRTPLTTVRGYLQLLERTDLDELQRSRIDVAQRQAGELAVLVDRLYEYAYLLEVEATLQIDPIDVGVLMGESLLGMSADIEEAGLDVDYEPPAELVILTDREKLTRIVHNLLRNATHHGRDLLAVELLPAGDGIELRVSNGLAPGAKVDAAQLFERFYTGDRSRSGRTSGLGLSIVQVLTAQLRGRVHASQDGSLLTLVVTLPSLDRS